MGEGSARSGSRFATCIGERTPDKLPKLTYSTREVAATLGVSRPTVDRLVTDGRLPSIDLGRTGRTLILAWAIEGLVARPDGDERVDQASSGLAT